MFLSYRKDESTDHKLLCKLLYMYKFLMDVIFEVFTVHWPSARFSSLIFIGKTLACINQRVGYWWTATWLCLILVAKR